MSLYILALLVSVIALYINIWRENHDAVLVWIFTLVTGIVSLDIVLTSEFFLIPTVIGTYVFGVMSIFVAVGTYLEKF